MPTVILSRAEVRAAESPCEHRWRHLRAWWIWDEPIGDTFYCERCLEYRRVRRPLEGEEENKTDVV